MEVLLLILGVLVLFPLCFYAGVYVVMFIIRVLPFIIYCAVACGLAYLGFWVLVFIIGLISRLF